MNHTNFTDIVLDRGKDATYGEITIAFGEFMKSNRISNIRNYNKDKLKDMFYMREIMSNYANTHRILSFNSRKARLLNNCVAQAHALLNAEIKMVELKSQYPDADIWQVAVKIPESELYWNPNCGKPAILFR